MDKLHMMAEALIKYETIDSDQIDDIMTGRTPREPANWNNEEEGGSGSAPATGGTKPGSGSKGGGHIGDPAGEH
jgi:cell division protease FtsH